MASQLASLRIKIAENTQRSTLPASIISNSHLDFQVDYIVKRRWLSYANMIRRGARFVSQTPLDMLILADHFTAEGAILAQLYRRTRTRILIALHSAWPCDRNWATWAQADTAIVPYKSAASRLRELSGISQIHVTGTPVSHKYRSLVRASVLARSVDRIQKTLAGRKIVVLVTNSLEFNCVPFVDLKLHFETLKALACVLPPWSISSHSQCGPSRGLVGEDTVLIGSCAGSHKSLTLLNGLRFWEAIAIADCIVGVNLPTGGYFEILEKEIPLIHVQTAPAVMHHPDLPSTLSTSLDTLPICGRRLSPFCLTIGRVSSSYTQQRFIMSEVATAPDGTPTPSKRPFATCLATKQGFQWRNVFRGSRSIPPEPIERKRSLERDVPPPSVE